jgi:hypothetical protein
MVGRTSDMEITWHDHIVQFVVMWNIHIGTCGI